MIYQDILLLIGRVCMCSLFLWAGFAKIMDWDGTVAYMNSKSMPLIPFFLPAAIFIQTVGSLALLLGYHARIAAWTLIIFILPASVIFHNFWALEGNERFIEKIMFMKDVGILGGLLAFAAVGSGRISLR